MHPGGRVAGGDVRFPALRALPLCAFLAEHSARLSEAHPFRSPLSGHYESVSLPQSSVRPETGACGFDEGWSASHRLSATPARHGRRRAAPGPPTCALTRDLSARRAAASAPIEGSPPGGKMIRLLAITAVGAAQEPQRFHIRGGQVHEGGIPANHWHRFDHYRLKFHQTVQHSPLV